MEKIRLIALVGPTASGKTALSIELAKAVHGEIISADSMQIYKGMDVGTAKPTVQEQQGIPHHLLSVLPPEKDFSVAQYCEMAHAAILEAHHRGAQPILTGGTGLYIDSVVHDRMYADVPEDSALREEMHTLAKTCGNEAVLRILEDLDPPAAARLHPNNLRRVIRAIEMKRLTNISILEHEQRSISAESRYDTISFGLLMERSELYERINQRVDKMVENGIKEEVTALANELKNGRTSVQALGYKELLDSLEGKCTFEEAIEQLKRSTRRYAKRQMTWFRRNPEIHWLDASKGNAEMLAECMQVIQARWRKEQ